MLVFLDSGATQHVFSDPDHPDVVWKLPAVFDALLPRPQNLSTFEPTSRHKAALWNRVLPLLQTRWLSRPANAGIRRYLRMRRVQSFRAMLRAIERVHALAGGDLLLPCQVAHLQHTTLLTPVGERRYTGPVLMQRRADLFMARQLHLDFDWHAPVRIQHALWRIGIGLGDADTVLGPHNWAILDGSVRLGDTGSLTMSDGAALAVMEEEVLRGVEERLMRRLAPRGDGELVRSYARVVRARLNQTIFRELWNSSTR
jgi:hypothetical protein